MSTNKYLVGSRVSIPFTGSSLSTLAAGTYVKNTTAIDLSALTPPEDSPYDVLIEVDVTTTNTPVGNQQVVVFVQPSIDGTNFQSGPTSGTTVTREGNLALAGRPLPITTASTAEVGLYSVFGALGYIPKAFNVVMKNDLGVALTAGTVWYAVVCSTNG